MYVEISDVLARSSNISFISRCLPTYAFCYNILSQFSFFQAALPPSHACFMSSEFLQTPNLSATSGVCRWGITQMFHMQGLASIGKLHSLSLFHLLNAIFRADESDNQGQ